MALRYNAHQATGTFNGITAGSTVGANALFIGSDDLKVSDLSAIAVVDAETNTITITGRWQVSNDKTTWIDAAHGPQNPAGVAIATGTAGADAAVTVAIPAPSSVYGFRFARLGLVVGVTTGASADTYTVGYSYRQV